VSSSGARYQWMDGSAEDQHNSSEYRYQLIEPTHTVKNELIVNSTGTHNEHIISSSGDRYEWVDASTEEVKQHEGSHESKYQLIETQVETRGKTMVSSSGARNQYSASTSKSYSGKSLRYALLDLYLTIYLLPKNQT
jgi:hypothetical protein